MKDFDGMIIFVLGTFVAGAIFFGIITIIRNSFQSTPQTQTIKKALPKNQKTQAQKIREQEKRFRRMQEQKLRDYRHR